jgi:hypothetical protein
MTTPSPASHVLAFDLLTDMEHIVADCNARLDRMLADELVLHQGGAV